MDVGGFANAVLDDLASGINLAPKFADGVGDDFARDDNPRKDCRNWKSRR
jgi:hypothetical protein